MATWHGAATPLKYDVKHLSRCLATEIVKCVNTESEDPTLNLLALLAWLLYGLSFCRPSWIRNTERGRGMQKERGTIQIKIGNEVRARVQWLVPSFIARPPLYFPLPTHTYIPLHSLSVNLQWLSLKGLVLCMLIDFWPRCLWNQLAFSLIFLFRPLTFVPSFPHGEV